MKKVALIILILIAVTSTSALAYMFFVQDRKEIESVAVSDKSEEKENRKGESKKKIEVVPIRKRADYQNQYQELSSLFDKQNELIKKFNENTKIFNPALANNNQSVLDNIDKTNHEIHADLPYLKEELDVLDINYEYVALVKIGNKLFESLENDIAFVQTEISVKSAYDNKFSSSGREVRELWDLHVNLSDKGMSIWKIIKKLMDENKPIME